MQSQNILKTCPNIPKIPKRPWNIPETSPNVSETCQNTPETSRAVEHHTINHHAASDDGHFIRGFKILRNSILIDFQDFGPGISTCILVDPSIRSDLHAKTTMFDIV